YRLGPRTLFAPDGGALLFTDNETNTARLGDRFGPGRPRFAKDAFHRHVIHGEPTTNPARAGTKAALHYRFPAVPPGGSAVLRLRMTDEQPAAPLETVDETIRLRRAEADEFFDSLHPPDATEDERRVQRQALAGLLWTKQSYIFDVNLWLKGDDPARPPPASRRGVPHGPSPPPQSARGSTRPDKWAIPVVGRLGPRLPGRGPGPRRSRLRQGAAVGAAVRAVPAPQRPGAGLRVGVFRPHPAGSRLGGLARLQHGPRAHRQAR